MRLIQKNEVEIKPSLQVGAGNGIFAKRRIEEGVVLPYFTLIKVLAETDENEEDDTYFMEVTYTNDKKKPRNISALIADGNPSIDALKKISPHLRAATLVNESTTSPPNCIFVNNSILSKKDILSAYTKSVPIPVTLLVTVTSIEKGEELYTLYGGDYAREYRVWRDRKGIKNSLVCKAYDIVEKSHDQLIDFFSDVKSW
jgi:hypothetical protein